MEERKGRGVEEPGLEENLEKEWRCSKGLFYKVLSCVT